MNKILLSLLSFLLMTSCGNDKVTQYQIEFNDGVIDTITTHIIKIKTIDDVVDGEIVSYIKTGKIYDTEYDASKIKSISKIRTITINEYYENKSKWRKNN